ncbi:hypothetical protein SD81_032515 [Tolypothrix campylonemoides VB511288]|nr:hypothetical protein SD81_032515 [Tolypothrix campylonemoides VB511288]
MGLGLSALTALLLLLPGVAFVYGLNRLLSPNRPPTALDQHFSFGFIAALAAATALHLVGLLLGYAAAAVFAGPAPVPAHALVMLAGQVDGVDAEAALRGVADHPFRVGAYFLGLSALGFAAGRATDRWLAPREPAVWNDLLGRQAGTDVEFVVLTAEVTHAGRAYLYTGFLSEYRVARDGVLERVVFRGNVARRPLESDAHASTALATWTPIPGEAFVLQMRDVRTVNIDIYYAVEEGPDDDDDAVLDGDVPEQAAD